jgi:hypothetical protein
LKENRKKDATQCFQRCIECTPQMALEVIKVNKNNLKILKLDSKFYIYKGCA